MTVTSGTKETFGIRANSGVERTVGQKHQTLEVQTPQRLGRAMSRLTVMVCTLALAACGGDDGKTEAQDGSGTETEDGSETTSGPVMKFDVEQNETEGMGGDCNDGPNGGENDFSVIWISNSPEGTVSKIDTVEAVELARYQTGPDTPDPSRTSVNLQGDVAIANRAGSITKIAARLESCVDKDDDGVIRTSQGPTDVLPWGQDECVLWHHDIGFPQGMSSNQGGPRAIAWDAGDPDTNGCFKNPKVWVGWRDQPDEVAIIRRLDGSTGQLQGETTVPDWQGNWGHGTYGGAANKDGDFWGLGTLGTLIHVDASSLDVTRWDNEADHVMYGIALDADGNPWTAGWSGNLWRFDAELEEFQDKGLAPGGPARMRGLQIDSDGMVWIAGNNPCGLSQFDSVNDTWVMGQIDLPGCAGPVGVSIDIDGYVWVVDREASVAFKVHPQDYTVDTVQGLVSPYTYSDMTGAGLGLVVNPPQG